MCVTFCLSCQMMSHLGGKSAESGSQGCLVLSPPLFLEGQVLLPAADQAYLLTRPRLGSCPNLGSFGFYSHFSGPLSKEQHEIKGK